jgi:hypothetical protein
MIRESVLTLTVTAQKLVKGMSEQIARPLKRLALQIKAAMQCRPDQSEQAPERKRIRRFFCACSLCSEV